MRKISANYIYTATGEILKNGIIIIDDNSKITDIINTKGKIKEIEHLEFYNGIIVPGFVNAHCHLELPHIKGLLNCKKKKLPSFIDEIITKRFSPDDLEEQIQKSDTEMRNNGIVAVGDISNTDDTFNVKKKSKLYYHTFVEQFTISNALANEAMNTAEINLSKLNDLEMAGTIVPHAPYTVTDYLFSKITKKNYDKKKVTSIHNQETESENLLFTENKGELKKVLEKKGFKFSDFTFLGKNSLQTYLVKFNPNDNILLIHNTFTSEEDIDFAEKFSDNIYWTFCPNSNLYIEDSLPKLDIFFNKNVKTCLGTDSYASNDELSILSEMKTIASNFPSISFENILESATINGANALMINDKYGSLEIGKTPGINLISNFDFKNMQLNSNSKIKVLA